MRYFSGSSNIKRVCSYYQWFIKSPYHGGYIETNHQFICLVPEDVEKYFLLLKFIPSGKGMLREVIDNDTKTRDKISLNGLEVNKY